jgi:hypothetical protein
VGTILSAAMLLRHSLDLPAEAKRVEASVDLAIQDGCRTRDLGGTLSTREMADAIVLRLDGRSRPLRAVRAASRKPVKPKRIPKPRAKPANKRAGRRGR